MAGPQIRRIKYQTVELNTTDAAFVAATKTGTLSFETDKLYEKVKGIAVELIDTVGTPNKDLVKFRRFEIGGKEIYPDGFYLRNTVTSSDVPLNKKFDTEVNEEAKGQRVDIAFEDAAYVGGAEYKFLVTLKLENPETQTDKK